METKKLKDLSFEALCGIIAKVIHSANRAYVDAIGGRAVNLTWEEIREEERNGLIKAIAGMITNPQTPQTSHEQWCLAREQDGWTKDVKYDYNRKTHPNMVPYDQLPAEEQFKDHLFMGIASIFCGGWGILDMPDVKAARTLIEAQFEQIEKPDENEETEALQEKLKLAEAMLDKLEAEQNAKDEEKPNLPDEPEKPLPSAEEILANEPNSFTATDLADAVFGGGPPEDIKIKEPPAETKEDAYDTSPEDQGSKQEKEEPVKTSDVQESTVNGVGKSKPESEAKPARDGEKVETAKPKAKKPAKKSSGK